MTTAMYGGLNNSTFQFTWKIHLENGKTSRYYDITNYLMLVCTLESLSGERRNFFAIFANGWHAYTLPVWDVYN